MDDGSIRIEEATEEALGTYTCVPYNTLGTMGQSAPARLVLKVSLPDGAWPVMGSLPSVTRSRLSLCFPQDPPYFTVLPGWEYRQEAGRELLIPCAAAGDPFPVITWRKVPGPSSSCAVGEAGKIRW